MQGSKNEQWFMPNDPFKRGQAKPTYFVCKVKIDDQHCNKYNVGPLQIHRHVIYKHRCSSKLFFI